VLRDALGLTPGSTVDVSRYGGGVQITPGGRTARLVRDADGRLVARSKTQVTDDVVFALIDSGLPLLTRDARARATYEAVGASVEVIPD